MASCKCGRPRLPLTPPCRRLLAPNGTVLPDRALRCCPGRRPCIELVKTNGSGTQHTRSPVPAGPPALALQAAARCPRWPCAPFHISPNPTLTGNLVQVTTALSTGSVNTTALLIGTHTTENTRNTTANSLDYTANTLTTTETPRHSDTACIQPRSGAPGLAAPGLPLPHPSTQGAR